VSNRPSAATTLDALLLGVPEIAQVCALRNEGARAGNLRLARPAWSFVIAAFSRSAARPLLVICAEDDEARDLAVDLEALVGRAAVALFPSRGVPLDGPVGASPHLVGQRARALASAERPGTIVVSGAPALAELIAPPEAWPEPFRMSVGQQVELDALIDQLTARGYERTSQVEERGEIAVRGGLVDVYPTSADLPIRIEFFGDEIESIRAFSPFTQRTIRPITRTVIWAAVEPVATDGRVDPLSGGGLHAIDVIRLDPNAHPGALRDARERFADEAIAGALTETESLLGACAERSRVDILPPTGPDAVLDAVQAKFATRGYAEAEGELARLARNGHRVVVGFTRRGDMERAALRCTKITPTILGPGELPAEGTVGFSPLDVREGMISHALSIAIIPEANIFRRRRAAAETGPVVGRRLASFMDLRIGDYVVHEDHGIGRLIGFETRTVANVTRDYLALAFSGSDRVFVPHDQLEKVTRYVGADGSEPTLSKLGGKAWDKIKARARAAVREMAGELISLYEARQRVEGFAFPPNDEWVMELEQRFAHRETPDQQRAIDAVYDDMERPRPMDRLICGDVGFGKTEIAMRAAFKAAVAGKQVMVLVPTTILAQQHAATFRERFADLPVSVDMVNRFRSQAETRDVLERFRRGALDILVGTHRLLSMDVQPADLGLVIVDEEQRFGVAQKEALRQLRVRVDVLALSATPIPRTLQISMSGLREISVIETPPRGRRPIATHVGEFQEDLVQQALRTEKERGGQSFFLHNRVETIQNAAERITALVPELRVLVAHGQMPEHQLEEMMIAFIRGEADVLVATSIIESGLDIPQANTLIVERADQLGLSQLYQIRGRVGRSNVTAHAYLLYSDESGLTREAAARLRALADYTELGSGLRIAMRDLEIRGAGNLLGDEQTGHVAAIGFELYVEMLQEAVALGQGAPIPDRDVRIEIPISAYIPAEYVPFEAAKIELHRRISLTQDLEGIATLAEEIGDRFGPLPDGVQALIAVQRLRLRLRALGAGQVSVRSTRIVAGPLSLTSQQLRALRQVHPRAMYESREGIVSVPFSSSVPKERIAAADDMLAAIGTALTAS